MCLNIREKESFIEIYNNTYNIYIYIIVVTSESRFSRYYYHTFNIHQGYNRYLYFTFTVTVFIQLRV